MLNMDGRTYIFRLKYRDAKLTKRPYYSNIFKDYRAILSYRRS